MSPPIPAIEECDVSEEPDQHQWFAVVVAAIEANVSTAGLTMTEFFVESDLCRTYLVMAGEREMGGVDVRLSTEAAEGEARFVVYLYGPHGGQRLDRRPYLVDGTEVATSGMIASEPASLRKGMHRIAMGIADMASRSGISPPRIVPTILSTSVAETMARALAATLDRLENDLEQDLPMDMDPDDLDAGVRFLVETGMLDDDLSTGLRDRMTRVWDAWGDAGERRAMTPTPG